MLEIGAVKIRFLSTLLFLLDGNIRFSTLIISSTVFFTPVQGIHYFQKNWRATFTWNYQVYGKGVDEPTDGQTFAAAKRQLFRLKVGFNS